MIASSLGPVRPRLHLRRGFGPCATFMIQVAYKPAIRQIGDRFQGTRFLKEMRCLPQLRTDNRLLIAVQPRQVLEFVYLASRQPL